MLLESLIWFVIMTLIIYLFYYLFMINKYDENGKLKKKIKNKKTLFDKLINKIKTFLSFNVSEKDQSNNSKKTKKEKDDMKIPTEVEILILKYHIDLSKINYKKLLKIVGLTCSIDISLIVTIISFIPTDNLLIVLLLGGLLVIPVILISYSILGNYFKRKGLVIKNEKRDKTNKRNRK